MFAEGSSVRAPSKRTIQSLTAVGTGTRRARRGGGFGFHVICGATAARMKTSTVQQATMQEAALARKTEGAQCAEREPAVATAV